MLSVQRICRFAVTTIVVAFSATNAYSSEAKIAQFGTWPRSDQVGDSFTVVDEHITIECAAAGSVLQCQSRSELEVASDASTPITLKLEVYALEGVALAVDGRTVPLSHPEGTDTLVGTATLSAGATHSRIVVTSPRAIYHDTSPETVALIRPATVDRHPLLGKYPGRPAVAQIPLVSVDSAAAWHQVLHTRIVLHFPGEWTTTPAFADCSGKQAGAEGCSRALANGDRELYWDFVPDKTNQEVLLEPHSSYFSNGGFLFGVAWGGGAGCLACLEAFRARAGYEIGLSTWGLLGVAGEFSTDSRVSVIPSLERVRWVPRFFHPFPTITAGLGVPFRLNPEFRVGGRFQGSLSWSVGNAFSAGLGFLADLYVTAHDVYPELAWMVQFGL